MWNSTSSPPVCLRGVDRDSFNRPDRRSMLIYPAAIFFTLIGVRTGVEGRVYRFWPNSAICLWLLTLIMNLPAQIHSLQRTVTRLVRVFISRFGIQNFITVFIPALQWFLSWAWWIHSAFSYITSLDLDIFLPFCLRSSKRFLCFKLCE